MRKLMLTPAIEDLSKRSLMARMKLAAARAARCYYYYLRFLYSFSSSGVASRSSSVK
jgi:hypothetical protein